MEGDGDGGREGLGGRGRREGGREKLGGREGGRDKRKKEYYLFQDDRDRAYTLYGKLSYDAPNMRMRLIEEDRTGEERESYDEIFLYKEVATVLVYNLDFASVFHQEKEMTAHHYI